MKIFYALLLVTSSCGMLDNFKDIVVETREVIKKSNEIISIAKEKTQYIDTDKDGKWSITEVLAALGGITTVFFGAHKIGSVKRAQTLEHLANGSGNNTIVVPD